MNKELKEKWVKALRSGEYFQGTGALQKDGKHCCLGVLCEVVGMKKIDPGYRVIYSYSENMSSTTLPDTFKEELKISDLIENDLISKNDSGQSFDEIADWIEENV